MWHASIPTHSSLFSKVHSIECERSSFVPSSCFVMVISVYSGFILYIYPCTLGLLHLDRVIRYKLESVSNFFIYWLLKCCSFQDRLFDLENVDLEDNFGKINLSNHHFYLPSAIGRWDMLSTTWLTSEDTHQQTRLAPPCCGHNTSCRHYVHRNGPP